MTSQRPYRAALSIKEALIELRKEAGHQFDPELVDKFIAVRYEVRKLLIGFQESEPAASETGIECKEVSDISSLGPAAARCE
ncbi:hypothetical protein KAI46_15110, partial [bacterium]|nr:hypothetical protein [bacterium]